MNFILALVFSVAASALAIYPAIALFVSAQTAVTAYSFLKDIGVPFKERIAACWQGFGHGLKRDLLGYVRFLGNAVKVTASWLVVLTLIATLLAPGFALGLVYGVLKYVVGGILVLAKEFGDSVDESISDVLSAAVKPADRSLKR